MPHVQVTMIGVTSAGEQIASLFDKNQSVTHQQQRAGGFPVRRAARGLRGAAAGSCSREPALARMRTTLVTTHAMATCWRAAAGSMGGAVATKFLRGCPFCVLYVPGLSGRELLSGLAVWWSWPGFCQSGPGL